MLGPTFFHRSFGKGFMLVLANCFVVLSFSVPQAFAESVDVTSKLVASLNKDWERSSRSVLVSETDFYDGESNISLPLAMELKSQLVKKLVANGYRVLDPRSKTSTAWVIQCRWKERDDKLTVTFIANPWRDWKRGKVIVRSAVVPMGDFDAKLFEPDMDSYSRTLVHRLGLNDNLSSPRSVYLRPLVVLGSVGGKAANSYFNHWLKEGVGKSNLLLPIDTRSTLASLSTATMRTRGFKLKAKTPKSDRNIVNASLTSALVASQSEIKGDVALNQNSVIVQVDLIDENGVQIAKADVAVPMSSLPNIVATGLKSPAEMEAEQRVSFNGLEVDISTTRGEGESEYKKDEIIQFLLRVNRSAYVYLFDFDSSGKALLLYPSAGHGTPAKKVAAQALLVLPDDGMPYEIVVSEPYGKDLIWAVASEEKLNIPDQLTGEWADMKKLKQRVRAMGNASSKGFAEAHVLVTTFEN